jgi:hypothetical protein
MRLYRTSTATFILCGAVFLLFSGGCGSGSAPSPGMMEVSWVIGGSSCVDAAVSEIQVSLYTGGLVYTTVGAPCQSGSVTIPNLPEGVYAVQVDGYRGATTFPTYTGVVDGIAVRAGAITVAPKVELAEKPGGLDVTWKFENGELCGANGVDQVALTVWDTHSNRIHEETLPCDYLPARMEAERNQPGRTLYESKGVVIDRLYAGQYTMRAFALNQATGQILYWDEAKPIVEHGTLTSVSLTLSSCDGVVHCE